MIYEVHSGGYVAVPELPSVVAESVGTANNTAAELSRPRTPSNATPLG